MNGGVFHDWVIDAHKHFAEVLVFFKMTKEKAEALLHKSAETGKLGPAIRAYEKLTRRIKDDHQIYNNLGILYLESGSFEQAIECFEQANQIQESHVHWNNLGRASLAQGKFDRAERCFDQAIAIESKDPQPRYNKTVCLREKGEMEEAFELIKTFVEVFPEHLNGRMDFGLYCEHFGSNEAAMGAYRDVLSREPGHLPSRLNMIRLCCASDELDKAEAHIHYLKSNGIEVMYLEHEGGDKGLLISNHYFFPHVEREQSTT